MYTWMRCSIPVSYTHLDVYKRQGQNLLTLGKRELCRLRNQKIGMIFQNPMSALNPVMTIGEQVQEGLNAHEKGMTRVARKQRVLELLEALKLPDPERCYRRYPHELSGGMRQRVMIRCV